MDVMEGALVSRASGVCSASGCPCGEGGPCSAHTEWEGAGGRGWHRGMGDDSRAAWFQGTAVPVGFRPCRSLRSASCRRLLSHRSLWLRLLHLLRLWRI